MAAVLSHACFVFRGRDSTMCHVSKTCFQIGQLDKNKAEEADGDLEARRCNKNRALDAEYLC